MIAQPTPAFRQLSMTSMIDSAAIPEVKSINLAAPASSAGVERVFSAAGKMHGDLSQGVVNWVF